MSKVIPVHYSHRSVGYFDKVCRTILRSSQLSGLQKAVEKRHGERISRAAEAEHELWHEVFRDRRLVWRWLLGGSM